MNEKQCSECDWRTCIQVEGGNARVHEQWSDYIAIGREISQCKQDVREKLANMNQMLIDRYEIN